MMKVMSKISILFASICISLFLNLNFIQLNMNPIVFSWIRIKFKLSSMLFNIFIQMKEVTKICETHSHACTYEGSSIFFFLGSGGKDFLGFLSCSQCVPMMFPWGSLNPQAVPQDVPNYASDFIPYGLPKQIDDREFNMPHNVYLWRKVVCLFCFVCTYEIHQTKINDFCVLGFVGKLLTRRGAWAWFHGIWTCSVEGVHQLGFMAFGLAV